jgi:hypothetical protein
MTKFALALVIASGYVLGQIILQLLGLVFEWAGKGVGWVIAAAMKQMLAARQRQWEAEQKALARQRSPIVRETGGQVDESHERES